MFFRRRAPARTRPPVSRAELEAIIADECRRRGTAVLAREVFVSPGMTPGSWLAGLRHPRDGSDVRRLGVIEAVGNDLAKEYLLKPE